MIQFVVICGGFAESKAIKQCRELFWHYGGQFHQVNTKRIVAQLTEIVCTEKMFYTQKKYEIIKYFRKSCSWKPNCQIRFSEIWFLQKRFVDPFLVQFILWVWNIRYVRHLLATFLWYCYNAANKCYSGSHLQLWRILYTIFDNWKQDCCNITASLWSGLRSTTVSITQLKHS